MPAPRPAPGPAPEPDPVVVRDVFPVQVTSGPDVISKLARVVITRGAFYVYENKGGTPTLVASGPYWPEQSEVPTFSTSRRRTATVEAQDGRTLTVAPLGGCGCGNPLKAWKPWEPYRTGSLS